MKRRARSCGKVPCEWSAGVLAGSFRRAAPGGTGGPPVASGGPPDALLRAAQPGERQASRLSCGPGASSRGRGVKGAHPRLAFAQWKDTRASQAKRPRPCRSSSRRAAGFAPCGTARCARTRGSAGSFFQSQRARLARRQSSSAAAQVAGQRRGREGAFHPAILPEAPSQRKGPLPPGRHRRRRVSDSMCKQAGGDPRKSCRKRIGA